MHVYIHPTLVYSVCPRFNIPENGAVSQTIPVTAFSIATFTCDEGYDLFGSTQRLCRTNGQWTGVNTNCTGMLLFYVENS